MKRIVVLLVSLILLLGLVTMTAVADSVAEDRLMRKQVSSVYYKSLASSGKESLNGFCGLMTGYQLYHLGVNNSVLAYNGKDQYNAYLGVRETSGGHTVKVYPASSYSLESALKKATNGGTTDVYNILVGFDWTNTEAGSQYGHAVVIHAILDGTVYFVEGFHTSLGGVEGNPITCSIETFARYYDDWCTFEGLVVFGNKDYTQLCEVYSTDMFVQLTEDAELANLPGGPYDQFVRTAPAGERFRITGVYENTLGQLYYRTEENGEAAYFRAEKAVPVRFNYENVTLENAKLPESLAVGAKFRIGGTVRSETVELGSTYIHVLNELGEIVLVTSLENHSWAHELGARAIRDSLPFESLEAGVYTYQILTYTNNHYVENGEIVSYGDELVMAEQLFAVGEAVLPAAARTIAEEPSVKDGWVYENDTWYYYREGEVRTGWLSLDGIDYYLDENGAITTGWAEINGQSRWFSQTGAMRTGWLETERGTMYMLRNGVAATQKRVIDETDYFFDENGVLCVNTWVMDGSDQKYVLEDGTVAEGWVDLPEGRACFDSNGRLVVYGN